MIDIITHGSPCQDFSVAGKGAGGHADSGTRSSLMHTTVEIVAEVMPKYVVWENVKNVLSAKHRPAFDAYLEALTDLGYNSYWKVLNTKHYGVPQNRERIFCISIRHDIDPYGGMDGAFPWPEPFDNGIRLKHLLEQNVDEKYYLSEEKTAKLVMQLPNKHFSKIRKSNDGELEFTLKDVDPIPVQTPEYINKRQNGCRFREAGSEMYTLNVADRHGVAIKEATQQGYAIAEAYDGVNIGMPDSETRRGRVGVGVSAHTLQTACDQGVLEPTIIDDQGRTTKQLTRMESCPTFRAQDHGNPPKVIEPQDPRVLLQSKNGTFGKLDEYPCDGHSPCVTSTCYKEPDMILEPNECNMLGRIDIKGMDCVKRVYSQDGISPALTTMGGGHREPKTMQNFRIRKLVPIECWRLQGQPDENFWKAKNAGISDSQLYKQAGNSITVDVLYHIFRGMFRPGDKLTLLDLFAGIGAFHEGLKRAGVEVDLFAYCEIDKYASKSYSAIHGVPETMNLRDVRKIVPLGLLEDILSACS